MADIPMPMSGYFHQQNPAHPAYQPVAGQQSQSVFQSPEYTEHMPLPATFLLQPPCYRQPSQRWDPLPVLDSWWEQHYQWPAPNGSYNLVLSSQSFDTPPTLGSWQYYRYTIMAIPYSIDATPSPPAQIVVTETRLDGTKVLETWNIGVIGVGSIQYPPEGKKLASGSRLDVSFNVQATGMAPQTTIHGTVSPQVRKTIS